MTRDEANARLNELALASGRQELDRFLALRERASLHKMAVVLRPYVLTGAQHDFLGRVAVALGKAMEAIVLRWHRTRVPTLPVPRAVLELIERDVERRELFGSVRFDLSFDPGTGRAALLEVQAGDPSGLGMQHAQVAHWAQACAAVRGRCESSVKGLSGVVGRLAGPGLVVFAIQRGAFVHFDQAIVCEAMNALGHDAVIADPDELSFDGRALWFKGRAVRCVVRDSLEELLLPQFLTDSAALLEAWRAGSVQVLNPAASILADHKVLLAQLGDEDVLSSLSPVDRQVVRETIARTRAFSPDLREEALAHQASFVLKPSDGYGGFDVVVGPRVDAEAWRAAVDRGARSGWILQDYVRPPSEAFPIPNVRGEVVLEARNVVVSAWLHGGAFSGVYARVHHGPVVNVHQGGGLLPVCVVSEEGQHP
jgi:hypothetical protein